jgi:hypothetical protein
MPGGEIIDEYVLREFFMDEMKNKPLKTSGTCSQCSRPLSKMNPEYSKVSGMEPGCKTCFGLPFFRDFFSGMDPDDRAKWAKKIAIKKGFPHGQPIQWFGPGYRNENLMFWDDHQRKILFPYAELDDYGSVPPEFRVEDGGFSPTHWSDSVDHNDFIILGNALVNQVREALRETPDDLVEVEINGRTYRVEVEDRCCVGNVAHASGLRILIDSIGWVDDDNETFHTEFPPEANVGEFDENEENENEEDEENEENENEEDEENENEEENEEENENEDPTNSNNVNDPVAIHPVYSNKNNNEEVEDPKVGGRNRIRKTRKAKKTRKTRKSRKGKNRTRR